MQVTVKLFAQLRNGRFKVDSMGLNDQARVTDVVEALVIPPEEVAHCLVNGHDISLNSIIKDGDTIALFPAIGG